MRDRSPPPVDWVDDPSATAWIVEHLHPPRTDVGSLVPSSFAAVARVFHRVEPPLDLDDDPLRPVHKVRWRDVAAWAGTDVDPLMTWERISAPRNPSVGAPPWGREEPTRGTLTGADLRLLLQVVEPYTTTPHRCWFGLWDGYEWLRPDRSTSPPTPGLAPAEVLAAKPARAGGRRLVIYRGTLGRAMAFIAHPSAQSPNVFWPDDRAWLVVTDPDLRTTYVAGPQALVDRLLDDPHLEALLARFDDPLDGKPD